MLNLPCLPASLYGSRRTLETLTSNNAPTSCTCSTHPTNYPACCAQEFKQGELLVRQGERADSMYAIKVRGGYGAGCLCSPHLGPEAFTTLYRTADTTPLCCDRMKGPAQPVPRLCMDTLQLQPSLISKPAVSPVSYPAD